MLHLELETLDERRVAAGQILGEVLLGRERSQIGRGEHEQDVDDLVERVRRRQVQRRVPVVMTTTTRESAAL